MSDTHTTLTRTFFAQTQRFAERVFLKAKKDGVYQSISWKTTEEKVRCISYGLLSLGLAPDECVAILAENSPEWVYADLAIMSSSGITVPIYPTDTPKEIEHILTDAHIKFIFASTSEQVHKLARIYPEGIKKRHIIITFQPSITPSPLPTMSLEELIACGKTLAPTLSNTLYERLTQRSEHDLASIIYTSGTTGPAKGVELTHRNFLCNCYAGSEAITISPHDVYFSFLPLSHVFERTCGFYLMMMQGATIAYAENMDTVRSDLGMIKPSLVCSVPRFFEKIYASALQSIIHGPLIAKYLFFWARRSAQWHLKRRAKSALAQKLLDLHYRFTTKLISKKFKQALGGNLRFFVSGGAPLTREVAEFFYTFDIIILEGYGMTETSPIISVNRPEHFKLGTVGLPLNGVKVQISSDGEIMVKGESVMRGYHHAPELTKEAFYEGWFMTGDIGYFDDEGFLTITDRKKELIITAGGKNISPQKIEKTLEADRFITQAFVYGDRKKYLTALIVPDVTILQHYARYKHLPHDTIDSLLIHPVIVDLMRRRIERCSPDLARYEKIKKFHLIPHEFSQEKHEVTPTLKLRRKIITEHYREALEAMFTND